MTEEKERYCLDCEFRKHQFTNKNNFCEIGYRLNPGSEKTTGNVLLNEGKVCRFNPWRREVRRDLFVKHGTKKRSECGGTQTH